MKYKTYLNKQDETLIETVLHGRGIDNIDRWINADVDEIFHWEKMNHMIEAITMLHDVIINDDKIAIVVDCDCDGYCSAAILNNFIFSIEPNFCTKNIIFIHHSGKQHGLIDTIDSITDDISLVICPDSSSNDYELHKQLNINILILDHHIAPYYSESINKNVVTVNPQLDEYPNKEVCGGFVVWQFCRAYNDFFKTNGELSTDLMALSLIGDMMSFKSIETRGAIIHGLKNISNPFFYQMLEDNKYILNKHGGLGYRALAFAVVPFINATVRSGSSEEKDLIFTAMCKPYCYDKVPFTKRGHKGETVPRYVEAAYKTASIKRRQTKAETDGLEFLEKKIKEHQLLNNAIILCKCEEEDIEPNIRGLVANKLANKYQRPCLVLSRGKTDDGECIYRGSGRNYGMSEITNLKEVEESTDVVEYVVGHNNAHGSAILEKNISSFIEKTNQIYSNVSNEPLYWVDYIWDGNEVKSDNLLELAEMSVFWGQDIPPSQICIKDINLSKCNLSLCGAKNDTLRIVLPNKLVLVKFQFTDDLDTWFEDNKYLTCIISPQKNEWNGHVSGEGIIEEYEVNQKWIF